MRIMESAIRRHFGTTSSRRLVALALACVTGIGVPSSAFASGSDIFGTWLRDDGNAHVRVAACGNIICATNLWIRDPAKQGEKVGDRLEFSIKRDGAGWRGEAYDPQRKLSFSASLSAEGDSMTTKGCMLAVVCRTTNWQRLPGANAAQ